jgi:flagellar biosynthetic protein FliO
MSREQMIQPLSRVRVLLADRRRRPLLAAGAIVLVAALALALPHGGAEDRSAAQALPPAAPTEARSFAGDAALLQQAERPAASTLASDSGLGATLLDVGLKLALTIGVLYLTLFLVRKYSGRLGGRRPAGNLAIVETVRLGQNGALHLVRVGDRHLLIGATATQISLLGDAGNLAVAAPLDTPVTVPVESPFLSQLRAAMGSDREQP